MCLAATPGAEDEEEARARRDGAVVVEVLLDILVCVEGDVDGSSDAVKCLALVGVELRELRSQSRSQSVVEEMREDVGGLFMQGHLRLRWGSWKAVLLEGVVAPSQKAFEVTEPFVVVLLIEREMGLPQAKTMAPEEVFTEVLSEAVPKRRGVGHLAIYEDDAEEAPKSGRHLQKDGFFQTPDPLVIRLGNAPGDAGVFERRVSDTVVRPQVLEARRPCHVDEKETEEEAHAGRGMHVVHASNGVRSPCTFLPLLVLLIPSKVVRHVDVLDVAEVGVGSHEIEVGGKRRCWWAGGDSRCFLSFFEDHHLLMRQMHFETDHCGGHAV